MSELEIETEQTPSSYNPTSFYVFIGGLIAMFLGLIVWTATSFYWKGKGDAAHEIFYNNKPDETAYKILYGDQAFEAQRKMNTMTFRDW